MMTQQELLTQQGIGTREEPLLHQTIVAQDGPPHSAETLPPGGTGLQQAITWDPGNAGAASSSYPVIEYYQPPPSISQRLYVDLKQFDDEVLLQSK